MQMIDVTQLTVNQWYWLGIGAFLGGMAKSGIKGLSMVIVPLVALAFGGKASSGLVLLIFMLADLFAIRYYRRAADWKVLLKLSGTALAGVFLGAWLGAYMDEAAFMFTLGVIILVCLAILLVQEFYGIPSRVANHPSVAVITGLLGGFSTMVANVSSPIMAIYLLAIGLPKNNFIGTIVWFFFFINVVKLPFHIFSWRTIDFNTLMIAGAALPAITLGFFFGLLIVRRIPEHSYRYLIMGVTFLAAVKMFF